MKILFDHGLPFQLAHGGFQVQIQKTFEALQAIGVEVDQVRWWDPAQTGNLIHFFGSAPPSYLAHAQVKNIPLVMTTLFTETCNRSDASLRRQGTMIKALLKIPFGNGIKAQLNWRSFSTHAHNVVGLQAEKQVLTTVYEAPPERISIVPLGTGGAFLQQAPAAQKEDHLVSVSTITPRKNTLLLATLAKEARVPILFVGAPYSKTDPYWKKFEALVDGVLVKHHPHVDNEAALAGLYRKSRGFALISDNENWCLTAHEAAACGIPVLLPDQKWSRECFGGQARYFPPGPPPQNLPRKAAALRAFYDECATLPPPRMKFFTWEDIARQLKEIYASLLK